jgi:protein HIRA/HIR1
VSGKQTQWLDYIPAPALLIKATSYFCAVAMQDGCVNIYSHTGRRYAPQLGHVVILFYVNGRLMPTLSLGSPCSFMDVSKHILLVITSNGQLYIW